MIIIDYKKKEVKHARREKLGNSKKGGRRGKVLTFGVYEERMGKGIGIWKGCERNEGGEREKGKLVN